MRAANLRATRFWVDRVKTMGAQNPSRTDTPGFQPTLFRRPEAMSASAKAEIASLTAATHAGMTSEAFEDIETWLETAGHPRFQRRCTDLTYQPKIEVIVYFRENGFKAFIVSGGGTNSSALSEEVYDIPREQVIGSSKDPLRDSRRQAPGHQAT